MFIDDEIWPMSGNVEFNRQARDQWRVSTAIPNRRREQLLNAPDFRDIVKLLKRSVRCVSVHGERGRNEPAQRRVSAISTFESARCVGLFHNASSGYRAQYLSAPSLGEQANAFTVNSLLPRVLGQLDGNPLRGWDLWTAHISLLALDTNAWIRQGLWLWHAAGECDDLMVPNWVARSRDPDKNVRRRVRYGRQLPSQTESIVIKGAWIDDKGQPVKAPPKSQARRSIHIHRDGFT